MKKHQSIRHLAVIKMDFTLFFTKKNKFLEITKDEIKRKELSISYRIALDTGQCTVNFKAD